MLTRKQSELLRFIHDRLQAEGVPPSFEEMKEALDLRSKSGIHRLIMALEERGFIKRLANRARAIEVLRLPESATVQTPARPRAFAPSVIAGNLGRGRAARDAAGQRQSAGDGADDGPHRRRHADRGDPDAHPDDPDARGIFRRRRPFRARSARQFDGRRRHPRERHGGHSQAGSAETGDIVVALIDGEEATLKRLRKRGASIALEAANPAYETRIFGPDRVKIQGKLVSLLRRY